MNALVKKKTLQDYRYHALCRAELFGGAHPIRLGKFPSLPFPKPIYDLLKTYDAGNYRSSEVADRLVQQLSWKISDDLDELFFEDRAVSPLDCFSSQSWMNSWIQTVAKAKNISVKLVTGSIAGKTVVAIPLTVNTGRIVTSVQLAAQDVSDYNGVAIHREFSPLLTPHLTNKIFEQIAHLFPGADCINFRKCLIENFHSTSSKICWREDLEYSHLCTLSGNWENDSSKFVGKSSRNSLKRKLKKLQKMGEITFGEVTGHQNKVEAVEKLCEWKANQLKELGSGNIFEQGAFCEFLRSTVVDNKDGTVRLFGMFLGGKPIALVHMLCLEKRWFMYQTAYTSEEAGRYSPGYLLLLNVMEEACRKGVEIFDFGWGNEAYKSRFATQNLKLYHAFMPLTAKGYAFMLANNTTERAKKLAKSNGYLRSAAMLALRISGNTKKAVITGIRFATLSTDNRT